MAGKYDVMNRYAWLIILLFALSCQSKKASETGSKQQQDADFFASYQKLKLPYHVDDTSFDHVTDTASISLVLLQQFVPDSAIALLKGKKNLPMQIHPVGKIEKPGEMYLLTALTKGKNTTLYSFLFDNKKHYLSHLLLFSTNGNDGYIYSADINSEPTFTTTKSKTVKDKYLFSRRGYAYSGEAKEFINVINETNEDSKRQHEVINPIDTLPKTLKYSADYTKDKDNFISVRDGNAPGKYMFFIHFDKNKGDCTGELKGVFTMVAANKAVFQQSGDPCVVDFTFTGTTIKVKERGSCGNHRGMNCYFDDTYKKKKAVSQEKEAKKEKFHGAKKG